MTRAPVALLGPQRFGPLAGDVVRELAPEGPVAMVTCGWRERERDDAELDALLDGRGVNLGLYGSWAEVLEHDPLLAEADRRRGAVHDELAEVYRIGLRHAVTAVYELLRHKGTAGVRDVAVDDALAALRRLDARHLELVGEVDAEFHAACLPGKRPALDAHRERVDRILTGASAVAIAGGHVDVLLECLQALAVADRLAQRPVVAWSAGAMAMTDRVVLFHDRAPHGPRYAEIHAAGLGLVERLVALPHARRRLDLDDRDRMAVFARRFTPDRCLLLDDGARVDVGHGDGLPAGALLVTELGTLEAAGER